MAEGRELKEVCIVEGCPNAGRHFVEEHDDYAVLAAKEWLAGKQEQPLCKSDDCVICTSIRTSNAIEVDHLALVIRKHVVAWSDQPCHHNGAHYPFCGHPDY